MPQPLLPEIIRLHGRWRGVQTALIAPDETLDWATFDRRTEQVANGLVAAGCGAGARVGVVMNNCTATVEVIVGAMKAGAIVAPLNTSVADDAIAAMLADAGATAIFATSDQRARIGAKALAAARLRVVAGADAEEGWICYDAWRDAQAPDFASIAVVASDVCNIIYSSGTTGQPKGIVHTHGSRLDWTHDLAHALRYHSASRLLIATGLYSNITWAGMLPTLMLGGTLIVRPAFDAADVLRTMSRERITHTSMVPVQYQRLLEHADFALSDRGSMQAMMCCGAPLPLQVKEALFEHFDCGVIELYGSTEGVVTTLAPEDAREHMSSVGKPLPGEDIVILDENNRVVGSDEPGEIVALSRFAMDGYWNNAAATTDAFWIDESGRHWLRSGDIGRIDAKGFLFITDRKKDMIISGGQNVYPADLEAVIVTHPDVLDCAVFGVPSDRWGESPLALVVLRDGAHLDGATLCEWANAKLGKQQRLGAVELRNSLPRNANGKLLKRDLRAPYWSTDARRSIA